MTEANAKPLVDALKEFVVDEVGPKKASAAIYPFKVNPEDGTYTFKMKTKFKPVVKDRSGVELDEDCRLSSGSTIRVAGSARVTEVQGKVYCSLGFSRVKVLEIVQYNADPFGDDEDEVFVDTGVSQKVPTEAAEDF
jgi:hypothetical protein